MPDYGADGAPTELLMRGCSSPDADGNPAPSIISIPCTQHQACTDHGFPVTRRVVSSVMLDVV